MESLVFSSGFYKLDQVLSFQKDYYVTVIAHDKVDTLSDYVLWPEINLPYLFE